MNAATDHDAVWARALELRDALLAGDAAAVEAMSTSEFWERAGRDELLELIGHVTSAAALGVLVRRSMLQLKAPGARHPESVLEQLWAPEGDRLLLEDQRLFTLVDRAEVEAAGTNNGWSGFEPSWRRRTPGWRTWPPFPIATWRRRPRCGRQATRRVTARRCDPRSPPCGVQS